jgi:large subunit ribosomal protein L35
MPKLKTKSGAKKRFGRTGAGKIKHNYAYKRHRLISKPMQGKRKRRGTTTMEKGDSKLVLTYMPYLRG